ncbi:MAG: methyl-accepting chemotaxis protein, partial [Bacteroidales bacterium]|nr:methyl-accepting chemotaxis protein [Bacteroidales bacterium]
MDKNQNHTFKKLHISTWIIALLSVSFYLLSLVISNFQTGDFGNNYSQIKLQKHISEIENRMEDIGVRYMPIIDSSIANTKQFYFSNEFVKNADQNDIHIFLIDNNNELIAWTDNDFVIEAKIEKSGTYFYQNSMGAFIVKDIIKNNYTFRCVFLLYRTYAVSNEYLKSGLNPNIGINKQVDFVVDKNNTNAINSLSGDYLMSVLWKTNNTISKNTFGVIFGIFILSFLFFISFTQQLFSIYVKSKLFSLFGKAVSILLIVLLYQNVMLPQLLLDSPIFSSAIFASSFISSLGSLFLQLLAFLFIVYSIGYYFRTEIFEIVNDKWKYALYIANVVLFFLILHFIKAIVSDLIFNSTISFNLSIIYSVSYLAIIGLLSIGVSIAIFVSVYINANKLLISLNNSQYIIGVIVFSILEFSLIQISGSNDYSILVFYVSVSIINFIVINLKTTIGGNTIIIIFLLLFSLLIAYWFNIFNLENERINRKAIIQTLAINQDPQAEYLFTQISDKMYADDELKAMFGNHNIEFDSVTNYIEDKYFKSVAHFGKYDFQTTVCSKDLQLLISPQNIEINCDTFFYKNLIGFGKLTNNKNLYRLDYGIGQVNYLGVFRFYNKIGDAFEVFTVYMEINSKLKRKGFTRVLRAKEYDPFAKISNYSLARYVDNNRVEKYGNYTFPEHLPASFNNERDISYTSIRGYNHLVYRLNDDIVYVLSLKEQPMLGLLAPFSYLFIIFGILFAILISFNNLNIFKKLSIRWSFGNRLQVTMVAIILSSFAIISIITLLYINDLDKNKNRNQLTDLSLALQIEFEHKLSSESDLTKVDPDYLQSLLHKFAKVFDTDINIYQLNGQLLSSTRYEVFERRLMSEQMNPLALRDLKLDHQSIYIDRENIGSLMFSSAYMPFHNSKQEIIAFMNLPYFAREEVLKTEISTLLMALMNVYILIIVVAILTILFVSKYISQPLLMLKEKLQLVSIGKENSKIKWHGIEEIEALVSEYNRMIDALALSSARLAKSERET